MSALLIAVLLGLLFVLSNNATTASAEINQGTVVPDQVRRDLPVVLDGVVFAHAQVGDRIFVGGDFQQVRQIDGTVIDQAYIFAYHADTGIVDPNFRPVLNNRVRSLATSSDGNSVYVGGSFFRWDDQFPLRIARLDAEGNLDTRFNARASAQVIGIQEARGSLFFVGDFRDVSGVAVDGIAKVNPISGAVDTRFTPELDEMQSVNLARDVVATANGSRIFILHYGRTVDGQSRAAVVSFDVASNGGAATLNGWRIPWEEQTDGVDCQSSLRAIAISPASDYIVIGGQGADNPPNCDSVLRYPTAGNGTVNFQWSARMYSSVFSLAVSDVAVYVGGHFCAAPRNGAPPGGVTSTFEGTANGCDVNDPTSSINPSQRDPEGAVFRSQMAALNPNNGQALAWDPGSNNNVAVFDLTLVQRGLLAGHDNTRFSSFAVGRSGFFDLEANASDTQDPVATITSPLDGSVPGVVNEVTGTATDNQTVIDMSVRLRNIDTGRYLDNNGSFVTNNVLIPTSLNLVALGEYTWSTPVNTTLAPGSYRITAFSRDEFGNTSTVANSVFVIGAQTGCSVSLNDQDQPVISIQGFQAAGDPDLQIRRNNQWRATVDNDTASFTDATAPVGNNDYSIRWRPDGVQNVACGSVTVPAIAPPPPPPPPPLECSVSLNGNGDPVITWDAIPGLDRYVVRNGDGWVSTVTNGLTFTDANAADGNITYSLRVRPGGVVTDIPCGTVTVGDATPIPGGATCAAVLDNGDVSLTWTAVAGVDDYQVRDNDGWVATESGLSFVDTNPTAGSRTYEIRYRIAGVVTDITCSPTVNVN